MKKIIDFYKDKFLQTNFWINHYFLDYKGPYVHIISITRRCNKNCIYCAAKSSPLEKKDMSVETAKKVIDFIFSIPLDYYHLEMQGGEPLINFNTLKFIVNYARKKANIQKKRIHFSLTTNLSLLDSQKLDFIVKNSITICSSFDPPFFIHKWTRNSSKKEYEELKKKISLLVKYSNQGKLEPPNLITTITRQALPYYKQIIDEYIDVGVPRIQLGMLEPIGRAQAIWDKISYTPQEYINFYRKALNYIYYLNLKKNIWVYEKGLFLLVSEILGTYRNQARNIDILLRLAYDVDGNIYSSDEFRMLGENGNKEVFLGNVYKDTFKDLILSSKTRNIISLILFPKSIKCHYCDYNIICNLAAHYSYLETESHIFKIRCTMIKEIFKIIENDINKSLIRNLFYTWIKLYG